MILEIATFTIQEGAEAAFMQAAEQGVAIFGRAPGCRGMQIRRCEEKPTVFVMLVQWETLEHHTVDFRQSEGVKQWRALVSPFWAGPPDIVNFKAAVEGF